jgi:hypothetical protein
MMSEASLRKSFPGGRSSIRLNFAGFFVLWLSRRSVDKAIPSPEEGTSNFG